MPQSHPTMGPVRFLSPIRFLACKAERSAHRNFTPVMFSWSHQATGPIWPGTVVHLWFDPIIHRTPYRPCAMPARALYGPRTGISNFFSYPTGAIRGPCWTPKGARTVPLRTRKGIDTTRICKISARASYVAIQDPYPDPYGPRTSCSQAVYDL